MPHLRVQGLASRTVHKAIMNSNSKTTIIHKTEAKKLEHQSEKVVQVRELEDIFHIKTTSLNTIY